MIGGIGAQPFEGEWRLLGAALPQWSADAGSDRAAATIQCRLARVPWRAAFGPTFGLWLVHHVALWWALELTAGRSLPGEFVP